MALFLSAATAAAPEAASAVSAEAAPETAASSVHSRRGGARRHLRRHSLHRAVNHSVESMQNKHVTDYVARHPLGRLYRNAVEFFCPDIGHAENLRIGQNVVIELRIVFKHFFKLVLFGQFNEFLES